VRRDLTEHSSTRIQPTLQISHGKLQPRPAIEIFNIRINDCHSWIRNIGNYYDTKHKNYGA